MLHPFWFRLSRLRGCRSIPVRVPAISQLDWLSSMTATKVEFCSKGVRDLLKSFGRASDVGDISALPDLLDQIEGPVGSVTAYGAYDGDTVYDEVLRRHPAARVVIRLYRRTPLAAMPAGATDRIGINTYTLDAPRN
jgi:hypothetical protein